MKKRKIKYLPSILQLNHIQLACDTIPLNLPFTTDTTQYSNKVWNLHQTITTSMNITKNFKMIKTHRKKINKT